MVQFGDTEEHQDLLDECASLRGGVILNANEELVVVVESPDKVNLLSSLTRSEHMNFPALSHALSCDLDSIFTLLSTLLVATVSAVESSVWSLIQCCILLTLLLLLRFMLSITVRNGLSLVWIFAQCISTL